jgi:predicted PurR-regulated permease PerM
MRELAPVLIVVIFSIFVALLFTPLVRWLKRKGVPGGLSVILGILLLTLIILVLGVMVVRAAEEFGTRLPSYEVQLTEFLSIFANYLPSYEGFSARSIARSIVSITISLMASIVSGIVNAVATAGIIMVTASFLLIDAASAPEKVNREIGTQSETRLKLNDFSRKLGKFLIIRTEINVIKAIVIALLLFIADIDFAILWGALIFLLGYIPYIGPLIASIPPIMLGFFEYGPSGALVVIVIIFVVDILAEKFLSPSLKGKGLQLSPAFLFPALIYWNFVLGLGGVLLSIPLTLVLKLLLENFEETKRLARLMGPAEDKDEGKISSG